jgi:SAM-dependent methyltransferase
MTEPMRVDRRVRATYDTVAAKYADRFSDELDRKPLERGLLAAFAEQVSRAWPVADIGCGPGHVTAHLASLGLRARGVDLSPGMIDVARVRHPDLGFAVGEMPGLPFADGELAGAVLLYSIIHLTAPVRAAALADLARTLRPGALALVGFHIGGDERVHVDNWFDEPVSFDGYLLSVQTVTGEMTAAGLPVEVTVQRAPYPDESSGTHRCYLLARKAG